MYSVVGPEFEYVFCTRLDSNKQGSDDPSDFLPTLTFMSRFNINRCRLDYIFIFSLLNWSDVRSMSLWTFFIGLLSFRSSAADWPISESFQAITLTISSYVVAFRALEVIPAISLIPTHRFRYGGSFTIVFSIVLKSDSFTNLDTRAKYILSTYFASRRLNTL